MVIKSAWHRTRLHSAFALVLFMSAHVSLLFFNPMLGCSFDASGADPIEDDKDHENSYRCNCECAMSMPAKTFQVSAALDDAEQDGADPADLDGSADLDLGVRDVGLRFVNVDIPQATLDSLGNLASGAVITSARLQFTADNVFGGSNTDDATLQIFGEATDDAPAFGSNDADLTAAARPRTTAFVEWSPPPWSDQSRGESGPSQRSQDLRGVIQEIVSRPGWQPGNALVLIISGDGRREVESFDGDPQRAAILEVEFKMQTMNQSLPVCMPADLNPNLGDPQNPTPTFEELRADCEGSSESQGRVESTVEGLAKACNYATECFCLFNRRTERFNACCDEDCTEVPLAPDCSNFDPSNFLANATNAMGDDPVCVAGTGCPAAVASAIFGIQNTCEVAGETTIGIGDETKTTHTEGTVQFVGQPCPGEPCEVGLTYQFDLDPITFDVKFRSDPKFVDLASIGASIPGAAALVDPSGAGMIAANTTESSIRGRRAGSNNTKAFVASNDPVDVSVDWQGHTCSLFGALATTVDSEDPDVEEDEGLTASVDVEGEIINEPPRANAGLDQVIECTSPDGAAVGLDGRGSSDPEDNIMLFLWFRGSRAGDRLGVDSMLSLQQGLGATSYVLRVIDAFGQADEHTTAINVVDTGAPELSLSVSPMVLWPPNHKFVPVTVTLETSDTCDTSPTIRLVSITSDEDDAGGAGNTNPDVQDALFGTDDRQFQLRAERAGNGDGRVYTITYEAEDASGNVTVGEVMVAVPKSQGMSQ